MTPFARAVLAAAVLATAASAQRQPPAPPAQPAPAPAPQDPGPRVQCKFCESRGSIPCTKHGKGMLEKEAEYDGTLLCSAAIECKHCAGALATECRSCTNPHVEQAILARRKLAAEWLAQRRKDVDDVTKNQPLWHLQTPHVDLVFSIRPMTIGKTKVETHPLMHVYGQRMEALRTRFMQLFELKDDDFDIEEKTNRRMRLQLYMFRDQQDNNVISPRVTGIGMSRATGTKLMGPTPVYSMYHDLSSMKDDDALHRNMVHNVTHLLLSQVSPATWIGNRKHGWVDEGLAHWFEDAVTGLCTNFCFEEVMTDPGIGWKGGRWRAPVRQMVDAGKQTPFAELSTLNNDQLDMPQHALAFAHVDHLLATGGGKKFLALARQLKAGKTTRDALQAVYATNPLKLETDFQAWVKATYAPVDEK